jgi:DNA polymerase-3 subunit chi
MSRIDFHTNVTDKIDYTCRLIRKASAANCRIIVFDTDTSQLHRLNEALWTFSETDFLPHVMLNDALMVQTPIILTDKDDVDFPHLELLVNLSPHIPVNFSRFKRVIEIVSREQQDTLAGRTRYRSYQQQGLTPSHIVSKI